MIDIDERISRFETMAQADPDNDMAHFSLGSAYLQADRAAEAAGFDKTILVQEPIAAALSLTRCAHKEVADKGVRVVGLSPGTVATDMQVVIKASGINPVSQLDPAVHIPTEWAAQAVLWLCTDAARAYDGADFSLNSDEARRRVGLTN